MKSELNAARNEINNMKARFEALEKSKNREIEEIKVAQESSKKKEQEREIKDLQARFQNERSQMEFEMKRFKDNSDAKSRDIEELRFTIGELTQKLK